jgi:hypothetical protein
MKSLKNYILIVFLGLAFFGFSQENTTDENQPTTPTVEKEAATVEATTPAETDSGNITDLIEQVQGDSESIIEAIKDPSFPPKNAAGWIAFIFATLIPFITKIIGDKAKYLSIFENIKLEGNVNAIIVWVSIGLAGIYEGLISQVDFSFTDWGGYSVLAYGFGMAVHEIFKSLQKRKEVSGNA